MEYVKAIGDAIKEVISHYFSRKEQHIEIVGLKAMANLKALFIEGAKMMPEIVEVCLEQGVIIHESIKEFDDANPVELQDTGAEA
jgi:hypothetical protein